MQINLPDRHSRLRGLITVLTGVLAYGWITAWPGLSFQILAGGAARLVGLISGSAIVARSDGWFLADAFVPLAVTRACSATDFYIMVALLLAWHGAARPSPTGKIVGKITAILALAVPLTIAVNTLRILLVAQAHRWVIPRFPASFDPILHMATGAAVFLPALILLNLVLESHESAPRSS